MSIREFFFTGWNGGQLTLRRLIGYQVLLYDKHFTFRVPKCPISFLQEVDTVKFEDIFPDLLYAYTHSTLMQSINNKVIYLLIYIIMHSNIYIFVINLFISKNNFFSALFFGFLFLFYGYSVLNTSSG